MRPSETSLVVLALLLHGCVCFSAFYKMKFEFVLNFGKEMVHPLGPKNDQHQITGAGEGDSDIKGARMLVEKFEVKPERRPI